MSDSLHFVDIIIWAMIAGFIFLRLRSVLGRHTGDEQPPQGRNSRNYGQQSGKRPAGSGEDSQDGQDGRDADFANAGAAEDGGIGPFHGLAPQVRQGLESIWRRDKSFDLETFMDGAKKAYEVILEGFWAGSRDDIQPFISEDIFDQFSSAINAREEEGLTVENKLVETTELSIDEARLEGDIAEITLRFISDIISITRNRDGDLVEGDMSDAVKVTDIWTFAKSTRSQDPNWTLIATRAG